MEVLYELRGSQLETIIRILREAEDQDEEAHAFDDLELCAFDARVTGEYDAELDRRRRRRSAIVQLSAIIGSQ